MRELLNIKNKMHIAMISYHACPWRLMRGRKRWDECMCSSYQRNSQKPDILLICLLDLWTLPNKTIVEVSPGLRLIHLPGGPFGSMSKKICFHIQKYLHKTY